MRLPLNYVRINGAPGTNIFEAGKKSGDVNKGDLVRLTGVRKDGKITVELPTGKPSEHWHSLDAFLGNLVEPAANDNG